MFVAPSARNTGCPLISKTAVWQAEQLSPTICALGKRRSRVSATDIPVDASFSADVFTAKKWYRYNLTGNDHQIWPTYDVYLVRRGAAVYKVQVTSYYSAAGTSRQITIRSAQIRS